jgi:hypothetical protein
MLKFDKASVPHPVFAIFEMIDVLHWANICINSTDDRDFSRIKWLNSSHQLDWLEWGISDKMIRMPTRSSDTFSVWYPISFLSTLPKSKKSSDAKSGESGRWGACFIWFVVIKLVDTVVVCGRVLSGWTNKLFGYVSPSNHGYWIYLLLAALSERGIRSDST